MTEIKYDVNKFKLFKDKLLWIVNSKNEKFISYIKKIEYVSDDKYKPFMYFEISFRKKDLFTRTFDSASLFHIFPERVKYYELTESNDYHTVFIELFRNI